MPLRVPLVSIVVFLTVAQWTSAQWTINFDEEPEAKYINGSLLCRDYPSANEFSLYKFHRETRKCYKVGEQGPCGELMAFYADDDNYGSCDCDSHIAFGRPLVWWPAKQRCYQIYSQGPCSDGFALDFTIHQKAQCVKWNCPDNIGADTRVYWFTHRGRCVQTGVDGFCADSSEVLFNPGDSFVPFCYPRQGIKANYGFIRSPKCLPGHKKDYYVRCSKYFGPDPDLGLKY